MTRIADRANLFGLEPEHRAFLDALCKKHTAYPTFAWALRHGAAGFHVVAVRNVHTDRDARYLADMLDSYWQVAAFGNIREAKVKRL